MRETEGHSSALGGRAVKTTHTEQEGKIKNEASYRDYIKNTSFHVIGVPGVEREKVEENSLEIITEKVPDVGKETDIQVQGAQRVSVRIKLRRPTPKC